MSVAANYENMEKTMGIKETVKKQLSVNTKIGDIMKKDVITADEDESVSTAAQKMLDSDVGSIVVLNRKAISGILTDRDIAIRCVAQNHDPRKCVVSAHMSSPVIKISSSADLLDAATLMAENHIKRLPVVDGNKIVGILSFSDFANIINQPVREVIMGVDAARQVARMIKKARTKPAKE